MEVILCKLYMSVRINKKIKMIWKYFFLIIYLAKIPQNYEKLIVLENITAWV